ncbi:IS3 family transposase [Lactobacillus delbrueckii]|uniref:IS3 family transposase n=1 Tax=Lactobacillus delbrueckii TaxID=1584 RepID=UPI0012F8B3AE|nr:IS3 family transposase [Lactobacillus delbrueckii]
MTKYSSELKVQIASDYLYGRDSYNGLSQKYNIAASIIRTWVKAAELNGLESLKVKRTKREYSVDFKLDVVSYYLKSDVGRNLVAAKFNISPSQVYSWTKKFQRGGPDALLPVKKGRPAKMPKKTEKAKRNKQIGTLTDKQKYEAKILEKDARIKELELELIIGKKSGRPVSTLSNRQKTQITYDIRADHPEFQLKQLFKALNLNRKTYYDNLKRIAKKDKYAEVKDLIKDIYHNEGQGTYGYRPMWAALRDKGVKLAMETVRKLMRSIGLKTEQYHKRTAKYSSYKGTVGKVADNLLQQHFDEERPYHVLHTDITEYALTNGKKVYISPVVDEASLEILACTASYSPDMELVLGMQDELETKLPAYSHPVIHSDEGSQYQSPTYQARLKEMELVQSMSRKGNCHDNAPGETIFNLMKRERLNRVKLHSLEEVQQELEDYIYCFNNIRRSNKLNYTTPVKYRDRVMATI